MTIVKNHKEYKIGGKIYFVEHMLRSRPNLNKRLNL